jgi:hypothetical protein
MQGKWGRSPPRGERVGSPLADSSSSRAEQPDRDAQREWEESSGEQPREGEAYPCQRSFRGSYGFGTNVSSCIEKKQG